MSVRLSGPDHKQVINIDIIILHHQQSQHRQREGTEREKKRSPFIEITVVVGRREKGLYTMLVQSDPMMMMTEKKRKRPKTN